MWRCSLLEDSFKRSFSVYSVSPDVYFKLSFPYAKCISCGKVTEILAMSRSPSDFPVRKIDKDHYAFVDSDGVVDDVLEYKHASSKADCYDSVRRSISSLRAIINTNCYDAKMLRWVTLTYAENMTDVKRLYTDFKNFWLRFCRFCKRSGFSVPEYISVVEPQGRGAWHCHVIFIFPDVAPFIDNNTSLSPLWGHGFTKIKAVSKDCDNLGAYFSAYLADLPLDDYVSSRGGSPPSDVDIQDKIVDGHSKKFVKGARLCLYPPGMNIYRTSRNIKRPVVSYIENFNPIIEKASSGKLTFSHGCSVVDDSTSESVNTICHFYYNSSK